MLATPRSLLSLTPEERDTYTVWAVKGEADRALWLSTGQWADLPLARRRELLRLQVRYGRGNVPLGRRFQDLWPQVGRGRFLWTPDLLTPEVLARVLSVDAFTCQREQVPPAVWEGAEPLLPRVRELAGTFPTGSAGNCFGAVMGAAGIAGAEHEWIAARTVRGFSA